MQPNRPSRIRSISAPAIFLLVFLVAHWLLIGSAVAGKAPPLGSHIPAVKRPSNITEEQWNSLFQAETRSGKRLGIDQIVPLVLHAEWPTKPIATRTHWRLMIGVFLLNVRPDGTVSDVEVLQSVGHPTATRDCINSFLRWRFRPGSLKTVRVPAAYEYI